MRNLVLSNGTWKYKIGRSFILIVSPNGKRHLTNQSEVSGLSWEQLERGYWKKWFSGIKPSMIKDWIEKNGKV
jgi:hypothetical protein